MYVVDIVDNAEVAASDRHTEVRKKRSEYQLLQICDDVWDSFLNPAVKRELPAGTALSAGLGRKNHLHDIVKTDAQTTSANVCDTRAVPTSPVPSMTDITITNTRKISMDT